MTVIYVIPLWIYFHGMCSHLLFHFLILDDFVQSICRVEFHFIQVHSTLDLEIIY